MRHVVCLLALAADMGHGPAVGGEIGFVEEFSLAPDRTVPLKQLIPGTEDYYFYHCLHYQNTEQWEKVDELLKLWTERYRETPRLREIENRQALLAYPRNPERALDLIRRRLNLQFQHQREELNQQANLPTALDLSLLNLEMLTQRAFDRHANTVQGFEPEALERVAQLKLTPEQRRQLLSRLQRPDVPGLVDLIVADLDFRNSGGFGTFPIHRQLLLSQLDELLTRKPTLIQDGNFVQAYIARLRPSDDLNWRQNPTELGSYLDRLLAFVRKLPPAQNSLKANSLYQRLVLDRSRGVYNKDLFLEYLKLPRNVVYVQPKWIALEENRRHIVDLNADYTSITRMPPIVTDEPLVRSYLMHFLVEAADPGEFAPYIEDQYLKHLFAETKIVHGLGDPEKWFSMLPPAMYQQLKERIDLDFAFTNKTEYSVEDAIAIDLYVKNVPTLIVKVFEINTTNFYRTNRREISTDINLDGLVANDEKTYSYDESPFRRVKRHFEFPGLNKRGVWVIDFIGNGVSSRALIRKGKLRALTRTTAAGQRFTILNEANASVPDAKVWLGGTLYAPDKEGRLITPFSNQPGRQPIVISHGDFSSLEEFEQEAEQYALTAGFYVDREELLSRRTAHLLVRPSLRVNGTPVSLKPLEEVRLTIVSTDIDGVATSKVVSDFTLYEDRESVHEFQVPQRTVSMQFLLTARIENLSQGKKVDLSAGHSVAINEIDRTEKFEDLHFLKVDGIYRVDLLGKSGEAQPARSVQFVFKLREFTDPVHAALQTDALGRIVLGPLSGVQTVTATGPQGTAHVWEIQRDRHTYPETVQSQSSETIRLPYMGRLESPDRGEVSLLELREGAFYADRFSALKIQDGQLLIGPLAPGDYSLQLKRESVTISIRVTSGPVRERYALGDYRKLEVINPNPLQIDVPKVDKEFVLIPVRNATKFTRVHVFGTRFQPAFSAYRQLAAVQAQEPAWMLTPKVDSLYVAGRNIGDEYRYILDRRFQKKYPGNMLERPSLLLNPWAVRSTQTGDQQAQAGDDFRRGTGAGGGVGGRPGEGRPGDEPPGGLTDFANLDFLAESSLVLSNLTVDDKGMLRIRREDLGPHHDLVFVAVDPLNTVSRHVSLPEPKVSYRDLRLLLALDPKLHFTQQKRITIVPKGQELVLPDISSARFQAYDTLGAVYTLYSTLNSQPNLNEFRFVLDWPKWKTEQKREYYSKYASHELSFFLYKKDRPFFNEVIRPYLANKKDKTFLDRWLLEEDLSEFTRPWKYERLNTFERVLLSQRLAEERPETQRYIKDQFDLLPPDIERFNRLFRTALKGSSLDTGDQLGLMLNGERLNEKMLKDQAGAMDGKAGEFQAGAGAIPRPGLSMPASKTFDPAAPPAPTAATAAPQAPPAEGDAAEKSMEQRKRSLKEYAKKSSASSREELERADAFFDDEAKLRGAVRRLYRKLDTTMEWAENNYYKLLITQQTQELVPVNAFWNDHARQDPNQPFLSVHLAEPSRNFTEMLLALSLLDLPFEAGKHDTKYDGARMTLTSAGPLVAFHEEILPAKEVVQPAPILVSQNFFRHGDRYQFVDNEQRDKFISDEFLVDVVYGCHIVVTNPTSSPRKVDVLLQIPRGALPVLSGQATKSVHLDLQPYHTQTLEYHFYFPAAGDFAHYPVHVGSNDQVLAFAQPFTFHVVTEPTNIDKQSWDYLSQFGTSEQVLNYLKQNNAFRTNLERIAFRMKDKPFFQSVISLLSARHAFNRTLWSYGVLHNEPRAIREFLLHENDFVAACGSRLESVLLKIDPVARHSYEHLEYKPLVNARVGRLGKTRQILNDRFLEQYQRLMTRLAYERNLSDADQLAVTYYLLLQDRVEEALAFFDRVNADALPSRLQYDYCAAYLAFSREQPEQAKVIAQKYANHPVDRWRNLFATVVAQAEEIAGGDVRIVDRDDRDQTQTRLAATNPSFDFTVEARTIRVNAQNVRELQVNYYLMDVELLFSRNPFVQQHSGQFAFIKPNLTQQIAWPEGKASHEFTLPDEFHKANVLVEISAHGETKSQAYYSNSMTVQMIESYGQVKVAQPDGRPLSKAYVKVYARMKDGQVRFFKDGYTDLRGRFDYVSLSTNEIDAVSRFSVLTFSDSHGAVVREADPPKR